MRSREALIKAANGEVSSSEFVPYGVHVAPNVIKLRSGEYMAIWKLDGITFETVDDEEINIRKEGLNNFLRSLSGGHIAVWTHKLRRKITDRLKGEHSAAFCSEFSGRYYDSFSGYRMMETMLYLTVIYRPTSSKLGGLFKRMSTRTLEDIKKHETEALDALDDVSKQVESSLSRYGLQRLGAIPKGKGMISQMLTFLGYLLNGVWEDVPMRRAGINDYLPASRLCFGDNNGMLQILHPSLIAQKRYVGFLDFQDYPKFSEAGMCNAILYADYEYIETQSFTLLGKRDAMDALDSQQNQLIASEDASETEIREMNDAKDMLQSGLMEMGSYHYTLAILGESLDEVAKSMSEARAALQDMAGFKVSVVDAIPECAWFAQLPGNCGMRPREATITSSNFSCLSPFHNFASGKRDGNPWGEALAILKTPNGQPYYLNLHVSPEDKDSTDEKYPGNTFVCGTTGVGKTVLIMVILAFATKYEGLRVVFFDKDQGAEIGIRAMGGTYTALKRGEPTGFNPFQLEATESNISFCERLVKQLVKGEGRPLTAREEADISQAVRTVFTLPHHLRRLAAVDQSLPNVGEDSLRLRLKKWIGNAPLGWVLDNPNDTQDFSQNTLFGYDYTEFLDDPEVRTPIMMYLLHVTESLIDGQPFMYFMEEFWKPLMDDAFSDFALNKQKTIRKQSGLGVFVTQSPSDVLTHRIGKTMVEQSVTKIFLPNPAADYDDYVGGFKVTDIEYQIIKNLGENSRKFLIKQGHRSAIVKLDLGGMNDILNVVSGSQDNVELLDVIRSEVGDHPKDWMPVFHHRIAERRLYMKR